MKWLQGVIVNMQNENVKMKIVKYKGNNQSKGKGNQKDVPTIISTHVIVSYELMF